MCFKKIKLRKNCLENEKKFVNELLEKKDDLVKSLVDRFEKSLNDDQIDEETLKDLKDNLINEVATLGIIEIYKNNLKKRGKKENHNLYISCDMYSWLLGLNNKLEKEIETNHAIYDK